MRRIHQQLIEDSSPVLRRRLGFQVSGHLRGRFGVIPVHDVLDVLIVVELPVAEFPIVRVLVAIGGSGVPIAGVAGVAGVVEPEQKYCCDDAEQCNERRQQHGLRHRRGERGVFTRRLYTLRGQRTFDEIAQKYRSDREFRDTVDRYVDDFEQLIESVSRNDRDNMLTQTYLTSDTGKVYLMLAHASGRLE